MEKKTCECGKTVEGYSKEHCEYMLKQHKLSKKHKLASKGKEKLAYA